MKSVVLYLAFSLFFTLTVNAQEKTRSYFCQQTAGPNSASAIATTNQATFVQWYSDGSIRMMDGTTWEYQGMRNGFHVYSFLRSTGIAMPNTQYTTAVFNADYSAMQVNYVFGIGMMGMPIQMYSFYRYIGDGSQPAYDWMSGKYN